MSVLITERPDRIPLLAACCALGVIGPASMPGDAVPATKAYRGCRERQHRSRVPWRPRNASASTRCSPALSFAISRPLRFITRCSSAVSTCARSAPCIVREHGENGERRHQRGAQHHAVPRLVAQAPNEVWTWDCSKLPTRARSVYLTLYVVLDLFSRFVLAWMVSGKENSALAQQLMAEATARYRIASGQLTIHQDRGAPMTAHRYIDVLSEMDVVLSHSRPRVSNDNAFSEAQFKTQKYQPDYPGRFDHAAHARSWCGTYFDWYNFEHHHSGLAGYTPEQVFTGRHREVAQAKQHALEACYAQHPQRFVAGPPTVAHPPTRVTINPVTPEQIAAGASTEVNFPTLTRVVKAPNKYELSLN